MNTDPARPETTPELAANDNPDPNGVTATTISLTDLAVALGIDEDEVIERIGDILLRREDNAES